MVAVPIPACMAWVTAESPDRLFMDEGLFLVWASCVFPLNLASFPEARSRFVDDPLGTPE
jgi:hypothetical protein